MWKKLDATCSELCNISKVKFCIGKKNWHKNLLLYYFLENEYVGDLHVNDLNSIISKNVEEADNENKKHHLMHKWEMKSMFAMAKVIENDWNLHWGLWNKFELTWESSEINNVYA